MSHINKTYNPKEFEERLYSYWKYNNYFRAEVDKNKEPFTIIMPPPNVTGDLHLGHAMYVIQDILTRWKRMDGFSALWLPGTDHASISTEARVVNKLRNEGKTKEELGREGFLEEAWDWTNKYGGIIYSQMERLGFSCDWSRSRFTLDEDMSKTVIEVFIELYEKGWIYKSDRIINYCPDCKTSISDAEVEHKEIKDSSIWHFKYPVVGSEDYIEFATTRPETMLGDLAIAVNPEDKRFKNLVGKTVMVPIVDREIPIIADDYVDPEFGTGAVKITPSHDANDFEVGERHNLGQLKILDDEGKINENGGTYQGLDRYEARKKIIAELDEMGLFIGEKSHTNSIGYCERCGTVIEPIISEEWFVKMEEMAKNTLDELHDNDLPEFIPPRFRHIYEQWLENIRDWNISRQLWWGHRLPVYYSSDGQMVVARSKPEDTEDVTWKQEEDTLDTWFSSALWPFSTLGWLKDSEDYNYFYPTDVLVTGYDIIFFWVVRMVFSAIEQTGQVPFKSVLLTGMVNDAEGRKMSKSLDNGIDPLDVVHEYGADALRFFLVNGNSPGNDLRYRPERVENARNFANKLWNASRFVLMNIDQSFEVKDIKDIDLYPEDKWILHNLNQKIDQITYHLDKYDIGIYSTEIYEFIWNELCDWYIEAIKPRMYSDDKDVVRDVMSVLLYVLRDALKLLHPIMPFITEEIYQHLPNKDEEALIIAPFPRYNADIDYANEYDQFEYIKDIIRSIRNIRSEMNIPSNKRTNTLYFTDDEFSKNAIESNAHHITQLGYSDSIEYVEKDDINPEDYTALVVGRSEILLPLDEMIDKEKEIKRLTKEKEEALFEIERAKSRLDNPGFVNNAPEKLVEEEKEKINTYEVIVKNIKDQLKKMEG